MADTGFLWIKNPSGTWVKTAVPYARIATGYKKAGMIYQKTGSSTWTLRYSRDVVPPAPLASMTAAVIGGTATVQVTMKAPADNDVAKVVIKWSATGYQNAPYPLGTQGYEVAVTPNQVVTAGYGNQTTGRVLYFTAWAIDSNGNVSAAKLLKYTVPTIYVLPTTVTKSAYFWPTDSGSWDDVHDVWVTGNDYVYQGGMNYAHGFWFYGSAIANALANAKSVTLMKITIARLNTAHGVDGPANVWLSAHSLKTKPTGNPNTFDSPGAKVGTLQRGEYNTFTVPSGYYSNFAAQKWVGCGLYYGQSAWTDPNYLIAYGDNQGADNGRIYIEWTE